MSRYGITYDEVAYAADKIKKQGLNPSIDRVREYLGTGSKTTINRHLARYKIENGLNGSNYPGIDKNVLELARLIQEHINVAIKDIKLEKEIEIRALKQQITRLKRKK